MSTPFRLYLPRRLYEEMLAHAVQALPHECCGLLAGEKRNTSPGVHTPGSPLATRHSPLATRYFPLVNAAGSATEFLSEPRSMFAVVKEMRRLGLETLAVYHSHPTSAPTPSRKDLEWNYSPDVMNLIISLSGCEPAMRGWWLSGEDYFEGEWELCEEEA